MKTLKFLLIGICLTSMISCRTKTPEKTLVNTANTIQKPEPLLIANNNEFAFDLYKNIGQKPENMFYSPFSISAAMGMTYAGSKGNTEKQISEVMRFAKNNEAFYGNYKDYLNTINSLNQDLVNIYTANSLWAQADFAFKQDYIEVIRSQFGGEIKNVNFIKDPEKCRLDINNWVDGKTNKKVENLILPGMIDDLTRLVLVNAIYFKASWEMPFDAKATRKTDFNTSATNVVSADFMTAENNYKYYSEDGISAIEIPYAKGSLSMLIILPKDNNSNISLNNIGKPIYDRIISGLTMTRVKLILPKFKTTSEFELSDVLKQMGMKDAFTDNADFTTMTGKKDLKISKVIHKAFINVDEAGTEAAAATAVIIRTKSAPMDVVEFKANHPFMFIIKENTSGSILFAGNVYDPSR
ncbi:MAG: serpin family protein [Bacteroidota bacterium]